jgi:hypothetical protein
MTFLIAAGIFLTLSLVCVWLLMQAAISSILHSARCIKIEEDEFFRS